MTATSEATLPAEELFAAMERYGFVPRMSAKVGRAWAVLWGRAVVGEHVVTTRESVMREFAVNQYEAGAALDALVHLGGFARREETYLAPVFDPDVFKQAVLDREGDEREVWQKFMEADAPGLSELRTINERLKGLGFNEGTEETVHFRAVDAIFHVTAYILAGARKRVPQMMRHFARMNFREYERPVVSVVEQHERILKAVDEHDGCALGIAIFEHSDQRRKFKTGRGAPSCFAGSSKKNELEPIAELYRNVAGGTFLYFSLNILPRAWSPAATGLASAVATAMQDERTLMCILVASPDRLARWAEETDLKPDYYKAFWENLEERLREFITGVDHATRPGTPSVADRIRVFGFDEPGNFQGIGESRALYLPLKSLPKMTCRKPRRDDVAGPIIDPRESDLEMKTFIATLLGQLESIADSRPADRPFLESVIRRLTDAKSIAVAK